MNATPDYRWILVSGSPRRVTVTRTYDDAIHVVDDHGVPFRRRPDNVHETEQEAIEALKR